MTNSQLQEFKNVIHTSLKAIQENENWCVSETQRQSVIRKICFARGQQDFFIIQQKADQCEAIKNLFENQKPKSCDFIVLMYKRSNLKIFFCEIKSSISEENCKEALKQMRSSKIFLDYLIENYKECFNKQFEFTTNNAENIYIYPAANAQKIPLCCTNRNDLIHKTLKITAGQAVVNNVYKFFDTD